MRQAGALDVVAFDADDTLWHNERFFQLTQARFAALLEDYADADHLGARLLDAERRNIGRYGYGIKGFVLSMIETALEVTEDAVPAPVIRELIEAGHEMLEHPIDLLPHVAETLEALAGQYRLALITKGDLLDQERKVAQSGLGEMFGAVEIVAEKNAATYREVFGRIGTAPERAVMVGNSLKSDVLPALAVGAAGVHVPHALTWALEHETAPEAHPRFFRLPDMSGLPPLLRDLAENSI
ncbi:HAD family hydrolase [Ovoidimarina sediminis]|uniref:HAD family hydrolase n=1 Tax=Ovoidimarina sediminis TaxID=3079856 RepID=UPI0029073844|nr:HAD family hydrolase [Rhodophyticola sp. MJ-SS7]MDU8944398.1 HAD family hydrolase [Rhodophyticola sp. MJ-SS7]